MYMKLADKHDAFENIGLFVRLVEHHFRFLHGFGVTKQSNTVTSNEKTSNGIKIQQVKKIKK